MFFSVIIFFHTLFCIVLIALVMLQQGKGADLGATFGGGSNSLFGAAGANSLLLKVTTTVAVAFMATSLLLVKYYKADVLSPAANVLQGTLLQEEQLQAPPAEQKPMEGSNAGVPEKENQVKKESPANLDSVNTSQPLAQTDNKAVSEKSDGTLDTIYDQSANIREENSKPLENKVTKDK
jgi:preprotein translocase subunit SecG